MRQPDEGRIDRAIVDALLAEHGVELKRFLTGVLRDAALAEDALQATWAKMIQRGHTARDDTRKAWLFRVALNEALALKRKAATGERVLRKLAWSQGESGLRPDESVDRQEQVERVRQALDALPADQRRVVQMRIYEDKKFAEIADELGIPLGTALGRMRSALGKLRSRLAPQDETRGEED